MGTPWQRRGTRTGDAVVAMRALCEQACSSRLPVCTGSWQVVVGGHREAALKRAAIRGDGRCDFNLTPDDSRCAVGRLHELWREQRRSRESFEMFITRGRKAAPESIAACRDAGVDER